MKLNVTHSFSETLLLNISVVELQKTLIPWVNVLTEVIALSYVNSSVSSLKKESQQIQPQIILTKYEYMLKNTDFTHCFLFVFSSIKNCLKAFIYQTDWFCNHHFHCRYTRESFSVASKTNKKKLESIDIEMKLDMGFNKWEYSGGLLSGGSTGALLPL